MQIITPVSVTPRLSVHNETQPMRTATFRDDVRSGLLARPKHLPPRCFYDDVGSALFEAITQLPEYYLTRAEFAILRESAGEIVAAMGKEPLDLLELGSGSSTKTRALISAVLERQTTLRYASVDISSSILVNAAKTLVDEYPALTVDAYAGEYFSLLESGALHSARRTMALFLGSNIGNFEPSEATALLSSLRKNLKTGDALLLGTDLKKGIHRLELAYDDPAGVTAAFNRNVLARINRELGADFDVRAFEHEAHYDTIRGAVDMYLVATSAHHVRVHDLDLEIDFTEFESIHTESSYKYSVDDIDVLAARSGFTLSRTWPDAAFDYALSLLVVG
jgi:L-histidine N-alpha-methyltransferase